MADTMGAVQNPDRPKSRNPKSRQGQNPDRAKIPTGQNPDKSKSRKYINLTAGDFHRIIPAKL